jgi:hypothetical protein
VGLGATFATKASALLLLPTLGLLWLAYALSRRAGAAATAAEGSVAPRISLLALLAAGGVAWLTLWACYGFERFTGPAAGHLDWREVSQFGISLPVAALRESGLLPDTFLWGLQHVLQGAAARVSFLAGEIDVHGRWAFFPLALGWKTPLATLLLLVIAGVLGAAALRRPAVRQRWPEWLPLLSFAGIYLLASLTAQLNIGVRHVVPAILPLFVLAGGVAAHLPPRRAWLVPVLLAVLAAESLSIHPHHLAFFNAAAGGPSRGYRLLVDSNLDWGQDLDALARYSRALPDGVLLHYAYFGTASPHRHGVRGTLLRTLGSGENPRAPIELRPGIYAVSATLLPNMFEPLPLRGAWRAENEPAYRSLRERADRGEGFTAEDTAQLNRLTFIRLLHLLRAREPEGSIHYSILLYRLEAADVEAIVRGPLPP